MANSDKDILITPNSGQSNDPKIEFKGATTGSASTITMSPLGRADGDGVLELKSAASGDTIVAFGEINTGSLLSVTDNSGKTKFEVNETGVVNANLNSGALGIPVGTTSERPPIPQAGFTRWNSTDLTLEVYNGTEWTQIVSDYFPSGSTTLG